MENKKPKQKKETKEQILKRKIWEINQIIDGLTYFEAFGVLECCKSKAFRHYFAEADNEELLGRLSQLLIPSNEKTKEKKNNGKTKNRRQVSEHTAAR